MANILNGKPAQQGRRTSVKRKVIVFSISLFLIIFIGSSGAFVYFMNQITHTAVGYELAQEVEIERIKLEASVNSEIALALKMAGSPLIQQYFMNPEEPNLEQLAHEEIAAYRRAFASNSVFWANDIDKVFWFDDTAVNIINPANPDEYWYNMTLYDTELYNFNINYNP